MWKSKYIEAFKLSCSLQNGVAQYMSDEEEGNLELGTEWPRYESAYSPSFNVHPNELIASLTEPPIQRRLRRYWPHDLLVRF
jgi:hypothetical protein